MDRPCFHLRVSVGPWQSDEARRLDDALAAAGSTPIDLPWDEMELCDDGLHFSTAGAARFAEALCHALRSLPRGRLPQRLLLLSDSTIGHHDYDEAGAWTGGASEALAEVLVAEVPGLRGVRVDAVCGSGFVACAREGQHYRARLAERRRGLPERDEACLLVGGWNDLTSPRHSCASVCAAAQACVALARSGRAPRRRAAPPLGPA